MPQYQNSEKWERKKSYLIRSLFEDVPLLSPLQEEQESRLSSISGDLRPDSPLPDLIIEIEPKKPNLCDEPEEFYEKLAKQMRRLYKRDHYSASESTVSLDYHKKFKENEELLKILTELSSSDDNSLHELQELENKGDHTQYNKIELKEGKSSCKRQNENVIVEYSTSSSEGNFGSHKNIQTPYDKSSSVEDTHEVAYERYSQISVIPAKTCNKSVRNYDENIRHESDVDTENSEEEEENEEEENEVEEEEYESLAINCDASRETNNSETSRQFSPEIMRKVHQHALLESLLTHEMSTSDPDSVSDKSIDIKPMEIEETVISYGPREVAISQSYLNTISSTSTPKSARKSKIVTRMYRNRSTSYSSSSHSCKGAGVQTSFSDDDPDCDPDNNKFWNQFFVGTPTIYNLCYCKNHVCS